MPNKLGWVYVLYDGRSKLTKIGRTQGDNRKRQATLSSANSYPLLNLINIQVNDCFAVELGCHNHFSEDRVNGEWFSTEIIEIMKYVHDNFDWLSCDFECPAKTFQYLLKCKL